MNFCMCPTCFKVYDKNDLKEKNIILCPDIDCRGGSKILFDIDELMIKPIQILNRKGYQTQASCSGHSYERYVSPYVYFVSKCKSCPPHWKIDEENQNVIRAEDIENEEKMNLLDKQEYIFTSILNLLKWAENLPLNCKES